MLEFLRARMTFRTRTVRRRLRFYACACCRRIWGLLADERSRRGIEVSERHADFAASREELQEAEEATLQAVHAAAVLTGMSDFWAASAAFSATTCQISQSWGAAATGEYTAGAKVTVGNRSEAAARRLQAQEKHQQADLLRCIFNPFREDAFAAAWRTIDVANLTRVVYEERLMPTGELDRDRLGVLADALEDAGCSDAEVLSHLRAQRTRVRGCWVVDGLTGRS
jgi:hypothetical protein